MLSPDAIRWACGRLEDFFAIHPADDLDTPTGVLVSAYGIDREALLALVIWMVEQGIPDDQQSWILFGILIGAIASEHES